MASTLQLSAIIDASETVDYVSVLVNKRGTLINGGTETVYLKFNATTTTASDSAGANVFPLSAGSAIRIPFRAETVAYICAAGKTSKLLYIED
jgi:hypothetical protein